MAACGLIVRQHVGCVGVRAIGVWWVGVLVVCILCLKFGIQTAHGTSHWWTSGRDVDLLSDVVELLHILAGLVWFTSSLVTCRKQYNNICEG